MSRDPDDVVRHLQMPDMSYWEAVKREVLYPFLAPGTSFGRKIEDRNIDPDDVYTRLYEKMVVEGKLKALKNRQYVIDFMLQRIKAIVSSFFERKGSDDPKKSKKPIFVSIDETVTDENGDTFAIDTLLQPESPSHEPENDERKEKIRELFNVLWRRNPKRAMVLLLRYVKGLNAREVKKFLNVTTENYVNQVTNLAKNNMKESVLAVSDIIEGC